LSFKLETMTLPTPLEKIGSLWVKRDDQSDAHYGGNKVRKLHYLLAQAKAKRATRLLTVGAAGSHHVLATVVHGKRAGFEVDAVLVPQIRTDHASRNLRAAVSLGLRVVPAANYLSAAAQLAWLRRDPSTYYIPLGGSSVQGSRGYVDAAVELAEQVEGRTSPSAIVVATGSGGTAAGLAVGVVKAGLAAQVFGVAVSRPTAVLGWMVKRLIRQLSREVGVDTALALSRFSLVDSAVGAGYGASTEQGIMASKWGAENGLMLDPTYTAKACSHASAMQNTGTPAADRVLYWHTLSAVYPSVESLIEESELVPHVRCLLTNDV
jgi:1-aminocyclopropane-1-carboxylate deaminase/D-cysteine desulfhydrase-like pyridoxal-dependent ACC family enzyme